MASILDGLREYFRDQSWPFELEPDETVLVLRYVAGAHQWTCYAQAREAERQLVFYSVAPLTVEPARRAAVMEFVTRANYDLVLGNFELDLDDGEVRFKTSIDIEGVELSRELIRPVVHANLLLVEQYLPGLIAVADGTLPPGEAMARCESDPRTDS